MILCLPKNNKTEATGVKVDKRKVIVCFLDIYLLYMFVQTEKCCSFSKLRLLAYMPSPPIKSFPTKSPRVELSGRPL